ncbi:MAG: FkbM family methyltransferase [Microscillaceae bacterium]|nr:FkbM family methyltransferase [Microscillaceae bacterium]MDW8460126.1 FkbM family methyltransferase [Cytophagales bacterium]
MLVLKIIFQRLFYYLRSAEGRTFLWLCFWLGHKKSQQPRKIRLHKKYLTVIDVPSFLWQYEEIFVKQFYRFQTGNPRPIIIDCGANIGLSILYFKKNYPNSQIIAFEADAQIAKVAQNNVLQYGYQDVKVYAQAVWKDGKGIFIQLTGADSASIFGKGEKTLIPSVRLKTILQQFAQIDMLKIDIEGAETEVITDCAEELIRVQNLFIEYHDFAGQTQTLQNILQILAQNQFTYWIDSPKNLNSPLLKIGTQPPSEMSLQLNIFAKRTSI